MLVVCTVVDMNVSLHCISSLDIDPYFYQFFMHCESVMTGIGTSINLATSNVR